MKGLIDVGELIPWSSSLVHAGDVYNRLTVLETCKIAYTYKYYAICQCSCGSKPYPVRLDCLRKGTVKSCGCMQLESVTTHGQWKNPLYRVWRCMHERCYKPKTKRFENHGGRGITVCDRWHNMQNFIDDMSSTYQEELQLDRIDNDKGYSPENCRWATREEQGRNKRNNVLLTLNGRTLALSEWAHITGLCYGTLWDRVKVQGWSDERTLTTPAIDTPTSLTTARTTRWRNYNKNK